MARLRSCAFPDPMFVSLPEYQFHVPEELAAPGAFYARALSLSTHAAWFVLTLRLPEPNPVLETFLLAWDTDAADALKTAPGQLESLMFVAPQRVGRSYRWVTKDIAEVWRARDPADDSECVLMIADDGSEHSGYFMAPAKGLECREFVARTAMRAAGRRQDA